MTAKPLQALKAFLSTIINDTPIQEIVELLVYKYTFVFRGSLYFLGQFPLPHTQMEAKWEVISNETAAGTRFI